MFAESITAIDQASVIPNQDSNLFYLAAGELKREQLHPRFLPIGRTANDADELIHVREGDEITFKGLGAFLGFAQLKTGATQDDFAAMLDESLVRFLK